MKRASLSLLVVACALLAPGAAHATEGEWHVGAAIGYGALLRDLRPGRDGVGLVAEGRFGLSDSLDLILQGQSITYPEGDQVVGGSFGLAYLIDVSRFVPSLGATVGVADVITFRCPPVTTASGEEGRPAIPCGAEVRPAIGIPFGLDYRFTPGFLAGVHANYAFFLLDRPIQQLFLGAHAGLAF